MPLITKQYLCFDYTICISYMTCRYHYDAGIPKESSLWYVPHLEEGIELIQKLDPDNKDAVQPSPGWITQITVYTINQGSYRFVDLEGGGATS